MERGFQSILLREKSKLPNYKKRNYPSSPKKKKKSIAIGNAIPSESWPEATRGDASPSAARGHSDNLNGYGQGETTQPDKAQANKQNNQRGS